jgi:hypothetical protein
MYQQEVNGIKVRQFSEDDIERLEGYETQTPFYFDCAMVSTCAPLFDDCDSNYEVEEKLEKAKVITKACEPDTESCALVVNFKRKDTARAFIQRLNRYLVAKAEKMAEAKDF